MYNNSQIKRAEKISHVTWIIRLAWLWWLRCNSTEPPTLLSSHRYVLSANYFRLSYWHLYCVICSVHSMYMFLCSCSLFSAASNQPRDEFMIMRVLCVLYIILRTIRHSVPHTHTKNEEHVDANIEITYKMKNKQNRRWHRFSSRPVWEHVSTPKLTFMLYVICVAIVAFRAKVVRWSTYI